MKKDQIKKDERKKILLITDDIRSHSGVGHIGREIIYNTCHKYNWVQIAGSINHPDQGKRLDLSSMIVEGSKVADASFISYPVKGYGTPSLILEIIKKEKIEAIFLITDPRYFEWLFMMENEIRKDIPIAYLNIWDDMPVPLYNSEFYESCDALFSINKQTKVINHLCLENNKVSHKDMDSGINYFFGAGNRKTPILLKYIPHGLDEKTFYPIKGEDEEFEKFKSELFKGLEKNFVLLLNSRNIRRKSIPDILGAWKEFTDSLPKEQQDKCLLICHTEPISNEGTDLQATIEYLFSRDCNNVALSGGKLPPKYMNYLYNCSDGVILPSSAEGWGLSLTEALLTATPFIATVTGGMQDQMGFKDNRGELYVNDKDVPSNHQKTYLNHGSWAYPIFPKSLSLVGSPQTPYIFDSRCDIKDILGAIKSLYNTQPFDRKLYGEEGMKWALKENIGFTSSRMGERVIEGMEELFKTWSPREKYEFYKDDEFKPRTLNHKLLYI